MRSDQIKLGFERAPHRGLLRATGVVGEGDFNKPFIAVCNSYVDVVPGHVHLQAFGKLVKEAIRAAGGVPFEFNTIGVDDGIAMGHIGMKYSLPSRELIADCVETMVEAHRFDGMVCIPNCDKIVPGMLMAAMRIDIPTIFVSGGPMAAGKLADGRSIDLISIFEGVGAYQAGKINDSELLELEQQACPTCGSCSGMFTANSMNCLMEALGMALPGNGSYLATSEARKELAREAGRVIMRLINANLTPRQIVNADTIDNAFALDMAMGGSTNTVLHTLALAREAGVDYSLERINQVAARTPHLCKVSPSGKWHMEDVDRAGGISAILKELAKKPGVLNLARPTVTLRTLGENIASAEIRDPEVILSIDKPYSERSRSGGSCHDAPLRASAYLQFTGRGLRGYFEGSGTARRCRGHSLRGAAWRSGHAGDAGANRQYHGYGPGRAGCSHHRWTFLRRHPWSLHRACFPGGSSGRPYCRAHRWRHDFHRPARAPP